MPIEILELTVRARVNEPQPPASQAAEATPVTNGQDPAQKAIERAAEEIMDILKRKNER